MQSVRHRRMIRRPSGRLWRDPVKFQRRQIEFIDKDVDHLNGIVLVNPVSKELGKQRSLTTICTFNKAPHPIPPQSISSSVHPSISDMVLQRPRTSKWAMYGRRPRCKRNLTYLRSVRVQPCMRPVFCVEACPVAMQPLWLLALM
jgi:hypothetical protein